MQYVIVYSLYCYIYNTTFYQYCQYAYKHHILDVAYDENRFKLLSKRTQENLNIFGKMGISIQKNIKKIKIKQSNLACLTVYLMIIYYWMLLEILQNKIFYEITLKNIQNTLTFT